MHYRHETNAWEPTPTSLRTDRKRRRSKGRKNKKNKKKQKTKQAGCEVSTVREIIPAPGIRSQIADADMMRLSPVFNTICRYF